MSVYGTYINIGQNLCLYRRSIIQRLFKTRGIKQTKTVVIVIGIRLSEAASSADEWRCYGFLVLR